MALVIIFRIIILSVFILMETFTAMNNKSSVFDSFFQYEFGMYMNTMCILVILTAIIIYSSLYLIKNRIKTTIFRMFYTSTIELAGRKGSRIFRLFLIIFVYLAILNFMELLFVAVTAKSQLFTNFWFSLTIIILVILLGIRNKGLKFYLMFWNTCVGLALRIKKNLLEKGSLVAFGVLKTLRAVLQSFIPATLGQIWANELVQILSGFFKIKNWCSKKSSGLKNPSRILTKINMNPVIIILNHDIMYYIYYFLIIYYVIMILDVKGKDIKTNFNYWWPIIKEAVIFILIYLMLLYIILGLVCMLFTIDSQKKLLQIVKIASIFNLVLALFHLCFIINIFKDKFSTTNIFFLFIYNICSLLIKILYKTKILDKAFKLVWFQFFNKNQKIADIATIISVILCLTSASLLRIFLIELRIFEQHQEIRYSSDIIFILLVLFFAGLVGCVYRLLVNFSRRMVSFTFLVFPMYYYKITARNNNANKPKIHFYYKELPVKNWILSGLVGIRLAMLYGFFYLFYLDYLNSIPLPKHSAKSEAIIISVFKQLKLEDDKILELLRISLEENINANNYSIEVLPHKLRLLRFCKAIQNPEQAAEIFKEDSFDLAMFYKAFPNESTDGTQVLSNSSTVIFDNILSFSWNFTNIFVLSFIVIVTAIFVYYYLYKKKNKITESKTEIIKKNDLLWLTPILNFFEEPRNGLLIILFLSAIIMFQLIIKQVSLTEALLISKSWVLKSKPGILIIMVILFFFALIFAVILYWYPFNIKKLLFGFGRYLFLITAILGILNIYFSLYMLGKSPVLQNKFFTKFTYFNKKFFPYIYKKCKKITYFLYKQKLLELFYILYFFQFSNKKSFDQNLSSGILMIIYLQLLRIVLRLFDGLFKNVLSTIDVGNNVFFVIWIFFVVGFFGFFFRTLINTSFKIVFFVEQNYPLVHKKMCFLRNKQNTDIEAMQKNIENWFAFGNFCLKFSILLVIIFLFYYIYYFGIKI